MPGLGSLSYIQIVPEAAYGYGTPAATQKLEIVSANISPVIGVIQDPSLYNAQSRRGIFQGGQLWRGSFTFRMNYAGLLEFLRGSFGTYTSPTVEAGVLDHTFKEGSTLKTYRIEMIEGNVSNTKCQTLVGAKFTGITVKGTAGTGNDAMIMLEVTVIAKDKLVDQTPTGALSFPSVLPVLFHQNITTSDGTIDGGVNSVSVVNCSASSSTTLTRAAGNFTTDGVRAGMGISGTGIPANTTVVSVGTTTLVMSAAGGAGASLTMVFLTALRVRSFEVSLDSPHTEDRFYMGALNIDEPLRSDFIVARWRLTQEFANVNLLNAAKAFTTGAPKIIFQHGTTIGAASKREFELRSGSANLVEFSAPIEGYGVIIATSTWEAWLDGTDASALVARVRNTETALP